MKPRWCGHCGAGRSHRSNQLCDTCDWYHRRTGRLPSARVLELRMNRRWKVLTSKDA